MQTINLKSYNIYGQQIREGNIYVDTENETLITQSGKKFKIVTDYEYTYKIMKTQIKASRGTKGLIEFFDEINNPESPFNPSITDMFIQL